MAGAPTPTLHRLCPIGGCGCLKGVKTPIPGSNRGLALFTPLRPDSGLFASALPVRSISPFFGSRARVYERVWVGYQNYVHACSSAEFARLSRVLAPHRRAMRVLIVDDEPVFRL